MSVRHNYDKQNLDYNLLRVETLEKNYNLEKRKARRFKKIGKDLYNKIEKLKIENEKLRYEQSQNT
tara:strand:+ start:870 stop:1067 length:198 start_codon:yes stop_codon:yes gene_type:complete